MSQDPFLNIATLTENNAGHRVLPVGQKRELAVDGEVGRKFEATVKGVQSHFQHLSADDIMYPPHRWFDAALARQIALHVLHARFDVPKRRIALELERRRGSISRALQIVDERLESQPFADTYEDIAVKASEALAGEGSE